MLSPLTLSRGQVPGAHVGMYAGLLGVQTTRLTKPEGVLNALVGYETKAK